MSFVDTSDIANQIIGDAESPYALISSANRYIGTIYPDVTIREVHTDEDTITVHPVETGTPVADHVFANPKVIEISCGFSDATGGYDGYVQQVYQEFLSLKATREPFDVSTGKRLYQNMLFGNITVVTDETSEFTLMVSARLQEVIITDTQGGSGSDSSSGSSSSSGSQDTQADPAETAPQTDLGFQSIGPVSSVPTFAQTQTQGFFNTPPATSFGSGRTSVGFAP